VKLSALPNHAGGVDSERLGPEGLRRKGTGEREIKGEREMR